MDHPEASGPEAAEPDIDITRTTASVLYSKHLSNLKAHLDGAVIWGLNAADGASNENSFLVEGNLQFKASALYTRYEYVQKSADELDLFNEFGETRFNIHAVSLGYNHLVAPGKFFDLSAGTKVTLNVSDKNLWGIYGKTPLGAAFYLQVRPPVH